MSQLDISISFSHLIGLVICFYIFLHYVSILLVRFWYNQKLRSLDYEELNIELNKLDNSIFIKRILKL
uniref:ATP synthase F0 subunit 8 n=1 Tax=Clava multicornis TaxID=498518 RepID=G9ISD1_CLAMU|nr:ATP synthase F0 subunit 8 [Clava multicornis]AER54457.1 ATP synthase F0 subunit 8 [Clava multicornis]